MKTRVLFIDAGDPWINGVVEDIAACADKLNIEFFFARNGGAAPRASDVINARTAKHTLDVVQPDIAIVWNGMVGERRLYAKTAKIMNIPFIYAEKGVFPKSWYVDKLGINAVSSIAKKTDFPKTDLSGIKNFISQIDKTGASAWEQPRRADISEIKNKLQIPAGKKIIFFPAQVDDDTNIIFFSPYFKNCKDTLQWICNEVKNSDCYIMVKPHPMGAVSAKEYQRILGNNGKAVADINIIDAIAVSDCVVSINSSAAFEAIIRGKPVVTLGSSILDNKNFSTIYDGKTPLLQCVEKAVSRASSPDYMDAVLSFADYLHNQYCCYKGNLEQTIKILSPLIEEIKPKQKRFPAEEVKVLAERANIPILLEEYASKAFKFYLRVIGKIRKTINV